MGHPKAEPQPQQLLLQSQLQGRRDPTYNNSAFHSAHPSNPAPSPSPELGMDGNCAQTAQCQLGRDRDNPRLLPALPAAPLSPGKHELCRVRAEGKASPPLPGQQRCAASADHKLCSPLGWCKAHWDVTAPVPSVPMDVVFITQLSQLGFSGKKRWEKKTEINV